MANYTVYVARNLDGSVRLFDAPPVRKEAKWTPQNGRMFEYLEINKEAFSEIKWEDNAKEFELIPK